MIPHTVDKLVLSSIVNTSNFWSAINQNYKEMENTVMIDDLNEDDAEAEMSETFS